ncbi:MAG: TIGR02647 family protein [Gammaproteobacteria bacterium]|nr:TIGR02647 family protein [Gammaproteobacteria bacterium]
MNINQDLLDELNVLSCFDLSSLQTGIKVHSDASESKIAATKRLFEKGLISQQDGGYLTDRGHEAAEHLQHLSGLVGLSA